MAPKSASSGGGSTPRSSSGGGTNRSKGKGSTTSSAFAPAEPQASQRKTPNTKLKLGSAGDNTASPMGKSAPSERSSASPFHVKGGASSDQPAESNRSNPGSDGGSQLSNGKAALNKLKAFLAAAPTQYRWLNLQGP